MKKKKKSDNLRNPTKWLDKTGNSFMWKQPQITNWSLNLKSEMHLSTADISTPAELLLPNLNVISSGCFFFDVIFTTEFSACLDWM